MQVIREELAKHGVTLKDGRVLDGVRLFRRCEGNDKNGKRSIRELDFENDPDWLVRREKDPKARKLHEPKPLKLDGLDPEKNVAVEFVSEPEYLELGGVLSCGTAAIHDFKDVARYVAGKVERDCRNTVYFGVFYDPMVDYDEIRYVANERSADTTKRWEKDKGEAKTKSKELLRQQVQDFAGWLKEKKVVP